MPEIITLPQELAEGSNATAGLYFIYKHVSADATYKNKILLRQNLFSFLLSGEKVLFYANKATTVTGNQFVMLSSGNCLMTERLSTDNGYASVLFFFDNAAFTNFCIKYNALIERVKLTVEISTEPFVVLDKDNFIQNYILSLDFLLQKNLPVSEEMMQLKFEEFMLYLLEKYPQQVLSFQAAGQTQHSDFEIKRAVEQNITTNITLEELAFLCNTSISTFKRRFVKLYNTTPSQYFLQRKMEIASTLLLNNETPSEVFFKVGYENHSSFSQSFKQVFGVSPKQYQQQNMAVYQ